MWNMDFSKYCYNSNFRHYIHTSESLVSLVLPDQNKFATWATALLWSGFLSSLDAAWAHCVRSGSWLSSWKQFSCSRVPTMSDTAASWARLSAISSSYSENACKKIRQQETYKKHVQKVLQKFIHANLWHEFISNRLLIAERNWRRDQSSLKEEPQRQLR